MDNAAKDNGVNVFTRLEDYQDSSLHVLNSHNAWVKTVKFSPDGQSLASGSDDRTIKLWDTTTGLEYASCYHDEPVYGITFIDDGKHLVSHSGDHTIRFWKADTGVEDPEFSNFRILDRSTSTVAFWWEKTLAASVSDENRIKVWDSSQLLWEPLVLDGHSSYIYGLTFSGLSSKMLLASASADGTVRIWNIQNSDSQYRPGEITLEGHLDSVNSVAFSPDANLLASGSDDLTVIVWNQEIKTVKFRLKGHTGPVNSVAFSLDGRLLASGSDDATVRLWNVDLGIAYGVLEGHLSWVREVSFSCDGRLASASDDKTVRIWDVEMAQLQRSRIQHSDAVTAVVFSSDSMWFASASADKTIKIWDRETGAIFATLEGHSDTVTCIAVSPNNQRIASASNDGTVKLWKILPLEDARKENQAVVASFEVTLYPEGHKDRVTSVTFLPDGKHVASGSSDKDVCVWEIETREKQVIIQHEGTVKTVVVTDVNGDTLVASGSYDNTVGLLQSSDGKLSTSKTVTLSGHTDWVRVVAFSSNGTLIASGSCDNSVKVWNTAETQSPPSNLGGHSDWITSLAFSSDDNLLVSASDDRTIRLWEKKDWEKKPIILEGHESSVNSICLATDNKTILSASSDMTVRIWDIQTRKDTILGKHLDRVGIAAFSPDGCQIVSGSDDGIVKLWDADKKQLFVAPGPITLIEFSATQNLIATVSNQKDVHFWNSKGKPLGPLGNSGNVTCLAFSADGMLFALGNDTTLTLYMNKASNDKTDSVPSRPDFRLKWTIPLPGRLNVLRFFGNRVATACCEGSNNDLCKIKLWEEGKQVDHRFPESHTSLITAMDVSSTKEGFIFATASEDKKIRVWYEEAIEKPKQIDTAGTLQKLRFSSDGSLITDRETKPPHLSSTNSTSSLPSIIPSELYYNEKWIMRASDNMKIFKIPDRHLPTQVYYHGSTVILGHKSGNITILEFDLVKMKKVESSGYGFLRPAPKSISGNGLLRRVRRK